MQRLNNETYNLTDRVNGSTSYYHSTFKVMEGEKPKKGKG